VQDQSPTIPRKTNRQIAAETRLILVSRFPLCFFPPGAPKRPLSIAIHRSIAEAAPDLDKDHVSLALRDYCGGDRYLNAVAERERRVGLDGSDAGEVSRFVSSMARRELGYRREISDLHKKIRTLRIEATPVLWCCHVRSTESFLPAESYASALALADALNSAAADAISSAQTAVPAIWPHSPHQHTAVLARRSSDAPAAPISSVAA